VEGDDVDDEDETTTPGLFVIRISIPIDRGLYLEINERKILRYMIITVYNNCYSHKKPKKLDTRITYCTSPIIVDTKR
jgi:hypothetical protein